MNHRILTLNAGSSSVKFAIYEVGEREVRQSFGIFERIGLAAGHFRAEQGQGGGLIDRPLHLPDHAAALAALFDWLSGRKEDRLISAIGHRVVQGGPRLAQPLRVTADVLAELSTQLSLAPNHLPGEIAAIAAAGKAFPNLPQVLCFDTAFHRAMPEIAQRLPLPRDCFERGIRRYGFHGLSYQYIVEELRRSAGPAADGRLVIAHLGNGASMAAVHAGTAVDTTMGLTPLGGLVMGTRTGDLDPGAVLHLLRETGMTVDAADDLLNKRSGLLGISGTSSDMKDLLDKQSSDVRAAEAVEIFCRQARKFVAAMAASLGGIDTLIFTGGIGERAAPIRERIVNGLGFLGMAIDAARNAAAADIVSPENSAVVVRVMKTNEELMIARQTAALL